MKKFFALLMILGATILISSCQKELPEAIKNVEVNQGGQDKNPEVKPSQELKVSEPGQFGAKGGEQTITVTATAAWTISKSEGGDWLAIKPESGNAGTAQVTLTAGENSSIELRMATIFVRSGELTKSVDVSQSAANPKLSLDKYALSFTASEENDTFTITSNTSWTITSDQDWCVVSSSSGSNNATITVKVSENTSTSSRSATITVKAGDVSETIVVKQSATSKSYFLLSTEVPTKNNYTTISGVVTTYKSIAEVLEVAPIISLKAYQRGILLCPSSWEAKDLVLQNEIDGDFYALVASATDITDYHLFQTEKIAAAATLKLKSKAEAEEYKKSLTPANPEYFWMGTFYPKTQNFLTVDGKGLFTNYTSLEEAMTNASRAYVAGEYAVVLYPSSWGAKDDLVFLDATNKKYYAVKKRDVPNFPDYHYYESTQKIGITATIKLSTETDAKAAGATLYTVNPDPTPVNPDPTPNPSTIYTRTFTVGGVTFKMIAVEGGTFTMGATSEQGDDAWDDEKPAHTITISSYSIGETEVTQALWQAVMGQKPTSDGSQWSSIYGLGSNYPAYYVSWNDCQDFISKLNAITGENFRLPTEAELEYAARGGNKSRGYKYAGSNALGNVAWYDDNSYSLGSSNANYGTHNVGTKQANELGLYDMSGNVLEWCSDRYGDYNSSSQTNPTGPKSGNYRVHRGGSWFLIARHSRVSSRGYGIPTGRSRDAGLRLAL